MYPSEASQSVVSNSTVIYHSKVIDMQCWTWDDASGGADGYEQNHYYFIIAAVVGGLLYYPGWRLLCVDSSIAHSRLLWLG